MNHSLKILLALPLVVALSACEEEDKGAVPASLSGLTADSLSGSIVLKWDLPEAGSNIYYVEVCYRDPITGKDIRQTASTYANTMSIRNTRKACGEYTFTIRTYGKQGAVGAPLTLSQLSGLALPYTQGGSAGEATKVELTASMLSTNAQETSEGAIANLLDGLATTFFHSSWSSSSTVDAETFMGEHHWMQVKLDKPIGGFNFYYQNRDQTQNMPTDMDVYVSTFTEGEEEEKWVFLKKFTETDDLLPTTRALDYTSPSLTPSEPVYRIRFVVNNTNSNLAYFSMAEFQLYEVQVGEAKVVDPENECGCAPCE